MWTKGTIAELCEIEYGTRVVRKNEHGNDYPVYGGGGETFRIDRKNRTNRLIVARFGMSEKCTRFVSGDFFLNDSGLTISPKRSDLSQDYLDKVILAKNNEIFTLGRGSAQKNLNMDGFKNICFQFPPLAEQQRIVAKLDAAFTEIDGAIEGIKSKEIEIEKLKASLSSASFSGDAEMWKTIKLGDVCDLSTGGTPSRTKPEYFDNGEVKWLVSGDINQREIFDCDGRITQEGLKNSNAKFLPLDSVLIALNGQGKTRGTVALLRTKATCNQSLISISPKVGIDLETKYIFYALDGMYDKIRKLTGVSGNDRRGLNMSLIRNIQFSYPLLAEQKRIVAKLDAAQCEFEIANEAISNTKMNYLALKSAILKKELQSEAA